MRPSALFFVRAAAAIVSLALLSSCTSTEEPEDLPAITEIAGPANGISVGHGNTATTILAIKRSSTFTGSVLLTKEDVPAGLVVTIAPATLTASAELAELTVTAIPTIAAGPHSFTVTASGTGVQPRSITIPVNVTVPTIALSLANTTATLEQGSSTSIPIAIERGGGFSGNIGLTVFGLPTGVTAVFTPVVVTSGNTTSTLTFSAPFSSTPTSAMVTVRAAAQGVVEKTIPVQVTLTPRVTPAITVSAAPLTLQVMQGQTGQAEVTIQRYAGYNGVVNLEVTGMQDGVAATAVPIAAGSNSTTLDFAVDAEATIGSRTVTLRATGEGVEPATMFMSLQTTQGPNFLLFVLDDQSRPQNTITLARGATATYSLVVSRIALFFEGIALTVEGVPAGVNVTLPTSVPPSTLSQQRNVVIDVMEFATPGTYPITVRGIASGGRERTATVNLVVQ